MNCSRFVICYFLLFFTTAWTYQVERLNANSCTVGEVPHWDVETQSLYYVNINGSGSTLNRYDYNENRVYEATIDNAPTLLFILPTDCGDDKFLVGIDNQAVMASWDGRSPKITVIETLFELDPGTTNIINDIKTDEFGRFYGGTKAVEDCVAGTPHPGAFYTYQKNKGLKKFFDGVSISNGLAWVPSTNKFYYIDSCAYDLREFDYDPETGDIDNGHVIYSTVQGESTPDFILDGMTNDVEGNLYWAEFGGSKVTKFDPQTRQILMEIPIPATQITSLAFGGPNLDILYVTTANKDGKQPEGSGYVYKVTGLGTKGYAGVKLNLCA